MRLLDVNNLQIEFGRPPKALRAVDGATFSMDAGETLCLVGESGSGKSVTALALARLLTSPPAFYVGGEILLQDLNVLSMTETELRKIRGGVISYVFQEPSASLNPLFRIGRQIMEALKLHRPRAATASEVIRLLKLVGIPAPETRANNYPHEMSGGMLQRVAIAIALASEPKLLVADEPTTALDVTTQAQIIDLLLGLKKKFGMAILLITHNLGIVGDIADRVAVMYAGQIVEIAAFGDLLRNPFHPYTRSLLNSVPRLGCRAGRLCAIPGNVPQLGRFPSGCRFHPRCPMAQPDCAITMDPLLHPESQRLVRCRYWNMTASSFQIHAEADA